MKGHPLLSSKTLPLLGGVLLILFFFAPWLEVDCSGIKSDVTGVDLAVTDFSLYILLLTGAAGIASSLLKGRGLRYMRVILLSLVLLSFLILMRRVAFLPEKGEDVDYEIRYGSVATILGLLLAGSELPLQRLLGRR